MLGWTVKPRIKKGLSALRPPMPENPNRVELARRIDKAEKLLQKGKTPEALTEYLQVLQDDPQNDNVRQMAADLSVAVGHVRSQQECRGMNGACCNHHHRSFDGDVERCSVGQGVDRPRVDELAGAVHFDRVRVAIRTVGRDLLFRRGRSHLEQRVTNALPFPVLKGYIDPYLK